MKGFSMKIRSFTLIELLVVVAIIAVLIAILLPAMSSARELAKVTTCANDVKQLGLAIMMYTNDSNGYRPLYWETTGYPGTWSTSVIWRADDSYAGYKYWDALGRLWGPVNYIKNNRVFLCPNNAGRYALFDYRNRKWDGTDTGNIFGSYTNRGYNQTYHTVLAKQLTIYGSPSNYVGAKIDEVSNRAIVSCDTMFNVSSSLGLHPNKKYPVLFGGGDVHIFKRPSIMGSSGYNGAGSTGWQILTWDEFDILGRKGYY